MTKKRLITSVVTLAFALCLFVTASFAWFAVSQNVNSNAVSLTADSGYIISKEITYYTLNDVYKIDNETESIKLWDEQSSLWVDPTYEYPEDSGYQFTGIIMEQYDPMIPVNNTYNQIYIEIHLTYDITEDVYTTLKARSLTGISSLSKSIFTLNASQYYYLSEVVYLQNMQTSTYSNSLEGENLFLNLKSDFESTDINSDLIYPKYSFYDEFDVYTESVSFDNLYLSSASQTQEIYLYFNMSYYSDKVLAILANENAGSTIDTLPYIRFYQDIDFIIDKVVG